MTGIYKITSKTTGKVYVGSSRSIQKRKCEHFRLLRNGKHHSILLQRAYDKYGIKDFIFESIELCTIEDLIEREQYYLDSFQSYDPIKGFNISKIAGRNVVIWTDEMRLNRSKAKRGKSFHTPYQRQRISETHKNRIPTQKMIEAQARPILQIDPITNQVINEFNTIQEAGRSLKFQTGNIYKTLKGRARTCNGYIWRYKYPTSSEVNAVENRFENISINKKRGYSKRSATHSKKIVQLDVDSSQIIATFDSALQAAATIKNFSVNIKSIADSIRAVCSGRQKSTYGFKWQYQ